MQAKQSNQQRTAPSIKKGFAIRQKLKDAAKPHSFLFMTLSRLVLGF